MIEQMQTFDPFAIYNNNEVHPYYLTELLMNNIPILSKVLLLDNIDTEFKSWNPYARLNSKFVEAFYDREKREITVDSIEAFAKDEVHGIVHGFFVGFWTTYLINKFYKRNMLELFQTEDNDFINFFYSGIVHDFYRVFEDEEHDKKLRTVFPNCIEETYRHTKPLDSDVASALIIADRIELMRFENMDIDYKVFESYLTDQELRIIHFFYDHFRPHFRKIWTNRHEQFITHYVENIADFDFSAKRFPNSIENGMPENVCSIFTRPNFYTIREINNKKPMYGILPIHELESVPLPFLNEHPALKLNSMNDKEDWTFLYTIQNNFQKNTVLHDFFPIRFDIMYNFIYLVDQLYGNLFLNTFYEES